MYYNKCRTVTNKIIENSRHLTDAASYTSFSLMLNHLTVTKRQFLTFYTQKIVKNLQEKMCVILI